MDHRREGLWWALLLVTGSYPQVLRKAGIYSILRCENSIPYGNCGWCKEIPGERKDTESGARKRSRLSRNIFGRFIDQTFQEG